MWRTGRQVIGQRGRRYRPDLTSRPLMAAGCLRNVHSSGMPWVRLGWEIRRGGLCVGRLRLCPRALGLKAKERSVRVAAPKNAEVWYLVTNLRSRVPSCS